MQLSWGNWQWGLIHCEVILVDFYDKPSLNQSVSFSLFQIGTFDFACIYILGTIHVLHCIFLTFFDPTHPLYLQTSAFLVLVEESFTRWIIFWFLSDEWKLCYFFSFDPFFALISICPTPPTHHVSKHQHLSTPTNLFADIVYGWFLENSNGISSGLKPHCALGAIL